MKNGSLLPPHMPPGEPPPGAVAADRSKLGHVNTYGDLPELYVDYAFVCADCGKHEVWTAFQQKWYYEEAKGHIWAVAVRCRSCRKKRKAGH
jgi:hypothetical protein